jgi:hypothetical protein
MANMERMVRRRRIWWRERQNVEGGARRGPSNVATCNLERKTPLPGIYIAGYRIKRGFGFWT